MKTRFPNKERRIRDRLSRWPVLMGLGEWHISYEFVNLPEQDEADAEVRVEYKEAELRFDLRRVPYKRIDAFVVHELAHLYTWDLHDLAENLAQTEEQKRLVEKTAEALTTELERMMLKFLYMWDAQQQVKARGGSSNGRAGL